MPPFASASATCFINLGCGFSGCICISIGCKFKLLIFHQVAEAFLLQIFSHLNFFFTQIIPLLLQRFLQLTTLDTAETKKIIGVERSGKLTQTESDSLDIKYPEVKPRPYRQIDN